MVVIDEAYASLAREGTSGAPLPCCSETTRGLSSRDTMSKEVAWPAQDRLPGGRAEVVDKRPPRGAPYQPVRRVTQAVADAALAWPDLSRGHR